MGGVLNSRSIVCNSVYMYSARLYIGCYLLLASTQIEQLKYIIINDYVYCVLQYNLHFQFGKLSKYAYLLRDYMISYVYSKHPRKPCTHIQHAIFQRNFKGRKCAFYSVNTLNYRTPVSRKADKQFNAEKYIAFHY
jgi:hypothetical protein